MGLILCIFLLYQLCHTREISNKKIFEKFLQILTNQEWQCHFLQIKHCWKIGKTFPMTILKHQNNEYS